MSGILNVRDFDLVNLNLLTSTGSIDLRFIMVELSYHEDLFNSVVSGYVMVSESQGYAELLSLTGNEFLHLTFNKGKDSTRQIDRYLRVYKLDKRKLAENMSTESYTLQFCSEELLLSEQYKVSKAYNNVRIDTIVQDICTMQPGLNIQTSRLLQDNILKTYGTYNLIVPNLKPFDAINWLCTYALPGPNIPGADMVFFENKNGFNFNSLQNMMDGPQATLYNTYTYTPKNLYDLTNPDIVQELTNVLTYEIMNSYDAISGINSGIFANQLLSVDVLTRTKKVTKFDYVKYKETALSLNSNKITNDYSNRNGDMLNETSQAVLKLAFTNFDEHNMEVVQNISAEGMATLSPNINAETYIPWRTAQLSLNNYTRVKISVPGDPNITVGSVIYYKMLSNTPGEKSINVYYSGFYLVTAVRHILTPNEYRTIMEIAKESNVGKYANSPKAWAEWSTAIK